MELRLCIRLSPNNKIMREMTSYNTAVAVAVTVAVAAVDVRNKGM
jgi:hypothetical protein